MYLGSLLVTTVAAPALVIKAVEVVVVVVAKSIENKNFSRWCYAVASGINACMLYGPIGSIYLVRMFAFTLCPLNNNAEWCEMDEETNVTHKPSKIEETTIHNNTYTVVDFPTTAN